MAGGVRETGDGRRETGQERQEWAGSGREIIQKGKRLLLFTYHDTPKNIKPLTFCDFYFVAPLTVSVERRK